MSDRWVLAHDPREGEHPEPMDLCPHGVDQNEADCGRCLHDDLMMTAERALLDRFYSIPTTASERGTA